MRYPWILLLLFSGPLYLKFSEIFTFLGTFFDGTSIKDENFKSNDINVKSAALFAKLGELTTSC